MNPPTDFPGTSRFAPFKEWSPSIHYAQFQRMPTGKLPIRRLYDFELLYVCEGKAVTHMGDLSYELAAGQLIVLPSGVFHQNEILSTPDARFLGIHFDFFDELDIQTEADIVVNEARPLPHKFIPEAAADGLPLLTVTPVHTPSPACVQLMEQLVHEFTMRSPGYELACKGLMLQILLHLKRTAMSSSLLFQPAVSQTGGDFPQSIPQAIPNFVAETAAESTKTPPMSITGGVCHNYRCECFAYCLPYFFSSPLANR